MDGDSSIAAGFTLYYHDTSEFCASNPAKMIDLLAHVRPCI